MDFDASTLVYIVAVVVYFLYSTFFRKKEPEQPDEQADQQESQPRKTVSFDEMLKEIRRDQGERERDLEGPVMEEEYEKEEEREWREKRQRPQPIPHKPFPKETQSSPIPEPASYHPESQDRYRRYEKQPLVKLEDQVDLESEEKILGEVEEVAGISRGRNRYALLLKNPETVREAVIVSEILQRKHF